MSINIFPFRQGYEDWRRHITDDHVNHRHTTVIKNGVINDTLRAMDIKVYISNITLIW